MAALPSDDIMPKGQKLTRPQHRLLSELRGNGGLLVVDGRRASVLKSLREMGIVTVTMTLEQDALRGRLVERWMCCLDPRWLCSMEMAVE